MARKKTATETEANGVALMDAPDDATRPADEPPTDRTGEPTTDAADAATGQAGALQEIDEEGREAIEWRASIVDQTRKVQELGEAAEDAKARASAAKKRWESAAEALHETILRKPEPLPLIDGAAARAAAIEPKADEAWRSDPIAILGLSESLTEKLADQGFHTIGHIADWSSKGHDLTDIEGVGAATAEKIDDALTVYWQNRERTEAIPVGSNIDLAEVEAPVLDDDDYDYDGPAESDFEAE